MHVTKSIILGENDSKRQTFMLANSWNSINKETYNSIDVEAIKTTVKMVCHGASFITVTTLVSHAKIKA